MVCILSSQVSTVWQYIQSPKHFENCVCPVDIARRFAITLGQIMTSLANPVATLPTVDKE
jgi:hypothetical protein